MRPGLVSCTSLWLRDGTNLVLLEYDSAWDSFQSVHFSFEMEESIPIAFRRGSTLARRVFEIPRKSVPVGHAVSPNCPLDMG